MMLADFSKSIKSLIRRKLLYPLLRAKTRPEYKARGVAVGLAWAFTPLVGVQMTTVLITWTIAKKLKWQFSLPLALAWTWVTNVFTMIPIYYVFYGTGQILRGRWSQISGFHSISGLMENVFLKEAPFLEKMNAFLHLFVKDWGISLFVGCVPFVIIGYIWGYRLTMRFEEMRQKRKEKYGKVSASQ